MSIIKGIYANLNILLGYGIGISIILGLIAGTIAYLLIKWAYRPTLFDMLGKKIKKNIKSPVSKDTFSRWIDDAEKELQQGKLGELKKQHIVAIIIGICAVSLIIGIFVLKNIVAALLMGFSSVLLIDQFILLRKKTVKEQMTSQLATAVRVFAATYSTSQQVEKGIAAVAGTCPNPLGKVFKKAEKMIRARIPLDAVLLEMAKGMNFDYGIMFIQLIKRVRNNTLILPLFHEMVSRITAREMLMRENRLQVDGERMLSLIMAVVPIPAYFVIQSMIPETRMFLSGTFLGKLVVCGVFLSAIIWAVMNRVTERVDA